MNPIRPASNSILKVVSIVMLIILVALLPACNKEIPLTEQETVVIMLMSAEAWTSPVVTIDGVDRSDMYRNFELKFAESTYTSSGGAPVWPATGSWEFIDEDANRMLLDGTLEVEINSISDDELELSLQWNENTFTPGREKSIKGKMNFRLKKK
jgi:hypothetical protein